jgi:hypothetical protein
MLNETEFADLFMLTLNELIVKNNNNPLKTYYLKWFRRKQVVCGVNLTQVHGEFTSAYAFWMHCYNFADRKLPIYDYNTILTIIDEKIEDGEEINMINVINWTIKLFKINDTLWYDCDDDADEDECNEE